MTDRTRPGRCDPDTARRLLAVDGRPVTLRVPELTEDADGQPLGVAVEETSAIWCVSPEALGWTYAELGIENPDPEQ